MLKTLSLVLPVLVPSWRFFKSIEPSPRVQWRVVQDADQSAPLWHDFRPRPARVSLACMLRRLFWNPAWNDTLFVVSLAERIEQGATQHSIAALERRIKTDLPPQSGTVPGLIQFRLIFVHRDTAGLVQEVVFLSDPAPMAHTA